MAGEYNPGSSPRHSDETLRQQWAPDERDSYLDENDDEIMAQLDLDDQYGYICARLIERADESAYFAFTEFGILLTPSERIIK